MKYLIFDLIENANNEYPKFSPHMVIRLARKGMPREGFAVCTEDGMSDDLPCKNGDKFSLFRPMTYNTSLAFIGERVEIDGIIFVKVYESKESKKQISKLLDTYGRRKQ